MSESVTKIDSRAPILNVTGLSKTYGTTRVLSDVALDRVPG